MAQGFSKGNQSSIDVAYRFGDFELHPRDRLLKKNGAAVPLQPKSFDALLCLVGRAGHLVSKQELTSALWPDVHVGDANLTNTIVSLRKVLGHEAIRTVSKHGYRFELPVTGEPGVERETYEKFTRAKELIAQRSLDSMTLARDLLWTCLAEDPGFAAAWAYLGRCCAFFDKFTSGSSASRELTHATFERAFALDPDIASAHQFYTLTQVDSGGADEAIGRLIARLKDHPGETESLAGLVQAFRYRGLLDESLEAHRRAAELDPAVFTGVAFTLFLGGEYAPAIEAYGGHGDYYLDAAAWATLGDPKRAITLLRRRLKAGLLCSSVTALLSSLLALLEGRTEDAVRIMDETDATRDPEIVVYFARHYARIGRFDAALQALRQAAELGFVCAPKTLRIDPWLTPLRKHRRFRSLARDLQALVRRSSSLAASFRPLSRASASRSRGMRVKSAAN